MEITMPTNTMGSRLKVRNAMARRVFNFIKNAPLSGRPLSEKTASLNKYTIRSA